MTKYDGLFIRDTLEDKGDIPSVLGAPTYSPDIICFQDSVFTAEDALITYDKYVCKPFLQDNFNKIFIRAKNNNDKEMIEGKVKAFYAPINVLYTPEFWTPLTTLSGDREIKFVDVKEIESRGVAPGNVGLVERPFILDSVKEPEKHHCMMGLATNKDGSYIDLPDNFYNDNGLWEFLRNHPQIAYNNIIIEMPEERTFMTPVQFGNYDDNDRKFILNISIMEGAETLENTKIIAGSDNLHNPIRFEHVIGHGETEVACEYNVRGNYFDYMDFVLIMPDYDKVKASIHVQNYAVNNSDDVMEPDVTLNYSREIKDEAKDGESATQLGDFYIYLGGNMDHVTQKNTYKRQLSLPELKVVGKAY